MNQNYEIISLENMPIQRILDTFNLSFSDYAIPMKLNLEDLTQKIRIEDISLKHSVGVKRDENLIGLILHGYRVVDGKEIYYNGGTGIIPSERGNHLVGKMYKFFSENINVNNSPVVLEVLESNEKAIKAYLGTNFKIERKLNCYQLESNENLKINPNLKFQQVNELPEIIFENHKPSWQNNEISIRNIPQTKTIQALLNEQVVGYLVYNELNKKVLYVYTLANYRNQNVMCSLFSYYINHLNSKLNLINVDVNNQSLIEILDKIGAKSTINQYEMIKK